MHLGYLQYMNAAAGRRNFLKAIGGAAATAGLGFSGSAGAAATGFKGSGRMGMATGEDWIDTFFTGGAAAIIHYYADEFVFEDVTLFQTITNKDDLYRAFLPFNNNGPDSPAGVHQFDVIRYDGGFAGDRRGLERAEPPENYTAGMWQTWSDDALKGIGLDYDEWAVMNWVWKATHNMDFLGLPAKGKTTYARGMTFHLYRERKVVREFTHWNFRGVAIQLGVLKPQEQFWLEGWTPPA